MAGIYQADVYCDDCVKRIRATLDAEGKTPEEPANEQSYDSDDYPKYADDDAESDCPQHCGSHADCVNAIELENGEKVGCLIGNNLTSVGVEYVRGAVAKGGLVADLWRREFDFIDFD